MGGAGLGRLGWGWGMLGELLRAGAGGWVGAAGCRHALASLPTSAPVQLPGEPASAPDATLLLQDDLSEVEELVAQVKEKTSNVQALSHATAGQHLLVRSRTGLLQRSGGMQGRARGFNPGPCRALCSLPTGPERR